MRYYKYQHINDILPHLLEESYQTSILKNFKLSHWIALTKTIPNPDKRAIDAPSARQC